MNKFDLYDFYLEYCVADNEIPLNFEEWEREIYPEDKLFLERIKQNEIF